MILSKRLSDLANRVEKYQTVADIGCDHALLLVSSAIKYPQHKFYACDINEKALKNAQANINKYQLHNIEVIVSDGADKIRNLDIEAVVMAGMGTNTIIKIINQDLKFFQKCKEVIIASNNDHYLLRKFLNTNGFIINKEKIISEKKHYYIHISVQQGFEKLTYKQLKYGKLLTKLLENKEYYLDLFNKNQKIYVKVPIYKIKKKTILLYEQHLLRKIIKELCQ